MEELGKSGDELSRDSVLHAVVRNTVWKPTDFDSDDEGEEPPAEEDLTEESPNPSASRSSHIEVFGKVGSGTLLLRWFAFHIPPARSLKKSKSTDLEVSKVFGL